MPTLMGRDSDDPQARGHPPSYETFGVVRRSRERNDDLGGVLSRRAH